jgi:glycogen debranching enzyme
LNQHESQRLNDNTLDLLSEARRVLEENDRGRYFVPTSSGLYPAQWNWDSCLTALGVSVFDPPRAWAELHSLFEAQWDDGMVPHIVFHGTDSSYFPNAEVWGVGRNKRTSGITQPPVAATVVRSLTERSTEGSARRHLGKLLPKILRWHEWFYSARDPRGTGLVAIIHPWESGMDNSPVWDGPMSRIPTSKTVAHLRKDTTFVSSTERPADDDYRRYLYLLECFRDRRYDPATLYADSPFLVADVGFNSILMRANQDLAYLLRLIGREREAIRVDEMSRRARRGLEALWNAGTSRYHSFDVRAGLRLEPTGIGSLLPVFSSPSAIQEHPELLDLISSWLSRTKFGLVSFDPFDHRFDPERYWRGPIWLVTNWMIANGLMLSGVKAVAREIESQSLALVEEAGFAEYFSPVDGRGLGGKRFSWTASLYLYQRAMLASLIASDAISC